MDADGSHGPEFLPEMLSRIEKYDFVIGSRYTKGGGVENWNLWRRILSRGGNLYAGVLIGLGVNDLTAGFTVTRRDLLSHIPLHEISATGYAYLMEMKFQCIHVHKATVTEVPIIFKERREGESKISTRIIREGLKMPLKMALRKRFGK
jgi:dolichol-phosphate mannosyltransferase